MPVAFLLLGLSLLVSTASATICTAACLQSGVAATQFVGISSNATICSQNNTLYHMHGLACSLKVCASSPLGPATFLV